MEKKQKKKIVYADESGEIHRQVLINSLNESVSLISTDPTEDTEYLCRKALSLMKKIKGNNGR